MKKHNKTPAAAASPTLRQRAEQALATLPASPAMPLSAGLDRTLQELQVHQVELKMQNEELRAAQLALEASRARYFDLYDLAPVGYVTVGDKGLILEANFSAVSLFGVRRTALVWHLFSNFIHKEDQEIWYRLRQKLVASGAPQSCELRMLRSKTGTAFWARVDATLTRNAEDAPVYRVVLTDISERRQAAENLQRQMLLQQLLAEIASTYINLPLDAVNPTIQKSLRDLALFVEADRAYVFDYDFSRQLCTNTHEWCAAGIAPQADALQAVPLAAIPDGVSAHRRGEALHVADVSALPPGGLRDLLASQSIQSLLTVPIMSMGECIGFVGFDSVRRRHIYEVQEQRLLGVFAQMLVHVRLRQLAEAELETVRSQVQLRRFATQLILTEEKERRLIAEALHDEIGQTLAFCKMRVTAVRKLVTGAKPAKGLREVWTLFDQMNKQIRSLTFELSPPVLYQLGLQAAVEWLGECHTRKFGGAVCVTADRELPLLSETTRILVFRSVGELFANIGKHAAARNVSVHFAPTDDRLVLTVRDDGKGFDVRRGLATARAEHSFGLFSVSERVRHLGGSLDISSAPGAGTTVTLSVPMTLPPPGQ